MKSIWKKWFRRTPKPIHETKTICIPDDKVEELARLDDALVRAMKNTGANRVEAVAFWKFLDAFQNPAMKDYPKGTRCTSSVDWASRTEPVLKLEITIPPQEESAE